MLKVHEPELKAAGGYFTVDLTQYNSAANQYTPNNIYGATRFTVKSLNQTYKAVA